MAIELEKSQLANSRVLKVTSGKEAKRLKISQETRVTIRQGKTAEAAIKQIGAQELQTENRRMQEWKQIVMQEIWYELQAIRKTNEETIEPQRYSFNMEIEKVKERLRQEEMQSTLFANEIKPLKTQKQASDQHPSQDTPTEWNVLRI